MLREHSTQPVGVLAICLTVNRTGRNVAPAAPEIFASSTFKHAKIDAKNIPTLYRFAPGCGRN
jgi:hypothetical protein